MLVWRYGKGKGCKEEVWESVGDLVAGIFGNEE